MTHNLSFSKYTVHPKQGIEHRWKLQKCQVSFVLSPFFYHLSKAVSSRIEYNKSYLYTSDSTYENMADDGLIDKI